GSRSRRRAYLGAIVLPMGLMLVAGIGLLWVVGRSTVVESARLRKPISKDDDGEKWSAIHFTRDRHGVKISRHSYVLRPAGPDKMTGSMIDSVAGAALLYGVSGGTAPGRLVLSDTSAKEPEAFGVEVYHHVPYSADREVGLIAGFNYAGELFV